MDEPPGDDRNDLSTATRNAGRDQRGDETSGLAGSLTGAVEVGADEPLTYELSLATSTLPTLFSKGDAVTYAVAVNDGGTPTIRRTISHADGDGGRAHGVHAGGECQWLVDVRPGRPA